ncbi:MAG: 30S ribosomal protein S18 [Deltaproteobacteria bacterium]|nr:MAG: 30S ribosomal protein S18 [Deltaproteobacteria bacterium]
MAFHGGKRMFVKHKACRFCADPSLKIDYKEPKPLAVFTSERGKIIPRRISGNCAKHQRILAVAIKRARNIALLPFTNAKIRSREHREY